MGGGRGKRRINRRNNILANISKKKFELIIDTKNRIDFRVREENFCNVAQQTVCKYLLRYSYSEEEALRNFDTNAKFSSTFYRRETENK